MADQLPVILTADTIWADAKFLSIGLSPFVWLTEPLFAGLNPDGGQTGRLVSLLFPVMLLTVHNEWVVRSQVRFEEASLARSRREAAKKDAASRFWKTSRARRQETPFRLVPRGRPETAIVWKNLMQAHRTPLPRLVLYGFVAVGVLSTLLATTWVPDRVRSVIAGMLVIAGVMTLVFMPLMAGHQWHNDLRSDLLRVELIRTWPLASWRLFAAEVIAPTIVATLYSAGGAGMILAVAIGSTLAGPGSGPSVVLVPAELAASLGVPDLFLISIALVGALPPSGHHCLSLRHAPKPPDASLSELGATRTQEDRIGRPHGPRHHHDALPGPGHRDRSSARRASRSRLGCGSRSGSSACPSPPGSFP